MGSQPMHFFKASISGGMRYVIVAIYAGILARVLKALYDSVGWSLLI
jgi:hypothetical protein